MGEGGDDAASICQAIGAEQDLSSIPDCNGVVTVWSKAQSNRTSPVGPYWMRHLTSPSASKVIAAGLTRRGSAPPEPRQALLGGYAVRGQCNTSA
jgi:hypothetical protein